MRSLLGGMGGAAASQVPCRPCTAAAALAAAAGAPPRPPSHRPRGLPLLLRPAATDPAAAAAAPPSSSPSSTTEQPQEDASSTWRFNPDPSSRPPIDEAPLRAAAGDAFWPLPPLDPRAKKRAVALHVAYLGTPFRGSQLLREPDARETAHATVEGALEAAMLRCGLIAPSNFGDLRRLGWSRASRTDRGVHSLGTVVGLRALVDESRFDDDPEGVRLADRINAALPDDFGGEGAEEATAAAATAASAAGAAAAAEAASGAAASTTTTTATSRPPVIRVLSAQRVTKRFDCRRWAIGRAYEYYLPASALGIRLLDEGEEDGDGDGAAEGAAAAAAPPRLRLRRRGPVSLTPKQAAVVARFKRSLAALEGHHPFHNYAGKRKQYASTPAKEAARAAVPSVRERVAARSARVAAAARDAAASASASFSSVEEDGDRGDAATTTTSSSATSSAAESDRERGDGGDGGLTAAAASSPRPRRREPFERRCWFLEQPDPSDPVSAAHYRTITRFAVVPWGAADEAEGGASSGSGSNGDDTANDVVRLVDGGVPCLRVRIEGASFMLNQIRNMVGSAAACARGLLPEALLAASLSPRVRAAMVKAPPHTLVLADTTFSPFATGYGGSASGADDGGGDGSASSPPPPAPPEGVARWSGERLELRGRGLARQAEWRRAALGPAVQELLLHEDWREWADEELPRLSWPTAEEVARRDGEWQVEERRRKAERRAAKEAAAAAAP